MTTVIEFDKSSVLKIIGQLSDAGHESRVKATLLRFHEFDTPGNRDAADAALAELTDARRFEIRRTLGWS